jgi:hypothetical protein
MLPKTILIGTFAVGCVSTGFFLGYHVARESKLQPATARDPAFATGVVASPLAVSASTIAATPGAPVSASTEDWHALQYQPPTANSEDRKLACLQVLGAADPAAALRLAASASTPRQRELFRNAALHGWGSRDPYAAADWALANVRSEERRPAVEAISAGAVARPAEAIRAINHLIAADPVLASDHGNALVTALARAGDYETASQFAGTGPAEFRSAWLCTAYNQWATYQPQAALAALEKIPDAAAAQEARAGLLAGWGGSDPAALVAYAQTLAPGEARLTALKEGLPQWASRDPIAASAWMDNFAPSLELDAGAAALASASALIVKQPDVAAGWAESIVDPELRANTLLDLIRSWGMHDVDGARHYAASSPAISHETRELALASLQPTP